MQTSPFDAPATDSLMQFLAGRDVPCPQCDYNLRDLAGDRCPECGEPLVLRVNVQEPKQALLVCPNAFYLLAPEYLGFVQSILLTAEVGEIQIARARFVGRLNCLVQAPKLRRFAVWQKSTQYSNR